MSSAAAAVSNATLAPRRTGVIGRRLSLVALGVGLALLAFLIWRAGIAVVLGLVARAGWWLPVVIALHLPQTLASAMGWGALLSAREAPPLGRLYLLRWIRESVNSLLPVAQIGGEVVRVRLLARGGVSLPHASASCVQDVTLELVAQLAFTLLGLGLLSTLVPHSPGVRIGGAALLGLSVVIAVLAAGQRFARSFRLRAFLAARLSRWRDAPLGGGAATVFRPSRGQQVRCGLWHLLSWMLGAVETWAAMHALELHAGLAEATVVESLGQVVRVAAFAIPGAVGVQEGGLIVICALFGAPPAAAIGLSLIRRLREAALGAPGLLAWRWAERDALRRLV